MAEIKKILLVDDDAGVRGIHSIALRGQGRQIISVETPDAALEAFAKNRDIALLVTDHDLESTINGMQLIRELRGQGYKGPVILNSGNSEPGKLQQQLGEIDGDNSFLAKGQNISVIRNLVSEKLGQQKGAGR